jgi:hypothetical protein
LTAPRGTALATGLSAVVALTLVTAATHHADETALSPIEPNGAWGAVYRVAVVALLPLYLVGLWAIRSRPPTLVAIAAIAVTLQLIPLAAPLLYSTDAYTYWDYGRIAAVHGGNPYVDPPSDWPDDPAYGLMGAQWHGTTAAYGPLWILTSQGVASVAGDDADRATWLFKAIAALASVGLVVAVGYASPLALRPFSVAFVGWNPVLPLQFAGGGHNDTLMMALPVAGLALLAAGRARLGAALWPIGIGVKWLPAIVLPMLAARYRRAFGWSGLAISSAIVATIATLAYGLHWVRAASPITNQLQRASSTSIPFYVERWTGIPQFRITELLAVLFAIAYLFLLREAWHGRTRLGLTLGLFCLSLSWLPAWYVAWPLSLAALEDDRAARWVALGLTAWLLRDAVAL